MICNKCGSEIDDDSVFEICTYCFDKYIEKINLEFDNWKGDKEMDKEKAKKEFDESVEYWKEGKLTLEELKNKLDDINKKYGTRYMLRELFEVEEDEEID